MTGARRELMFGIVGLAVLGVVAYVLFTQAAGPDASAPAREAAAAAGTAGARATPTFAPSPTPTMRATATPTPNPQTYVVQPGDTLLSIAQRFSITVADLSAKNEILDPNNIFAGQKLLLPQPGERVQPGAEASENESVYIVQPGDTVFAIAQELDVAIEDLQELNEITDPTQLFVGRRLQVPPRRLTPPTPRPPP